MLRFEPHQRSRVEIVRQGNIEKTFNASTPFGVVSVSFKEDRTQQVTVSSNGGYGIRFFISKPAGGGPPTYSRWFTVKRHWGPVTREWSRTTMSDGKVVINYLVEMFFEECNGNTGSVAYQPGFYSIRSDGQYGGSEGYYYDSMQFDSNRNCGSVVETHRSRVWEGRELTKDGTITLGTFASAFYSPSTFDAEIAKFSFPFYPIRYCPQNHGICWKDPVTKNAELGWCCLPCAEIVGKSRSILGNVKIPKRL